MKKRKNLSGPDSDAHWQSVAFGSLILLISAGHVHADLLISQYYEGSSNNKWFEVYNLGNESINLTASDFRIGLWSNLSREGWKSDVAPGSASQLIGVIGAGGALSIANSSSVLPFEAARANMISGAVTFNGDDSVALYTGSTYSFANLIDVFGLTGNTAADTSYSRKTSISVGTNVDFDAADWDQFTIATVNAAAVTANERIGIYRRGGITVVWDANGTSNGTGGSGTWDTTSNRFTSKPGSTSVSTDFYPWSDISNARDYVLFAGNAGNVGISANRTAGGLIFTTNGYEIGPSTRTLTLDGTGVIETVGSSVSTTIAARLGTSVGVDIIKTGTGTLRLTGDNTYAGATTVRAGRLEVNATHTGGGAYTVKAGGTLGGIGNTGAPVAVESGGTLAPGMSIGVLTVQALDLNAGSTYSVELDVTDGNEAADRTNISGTGALALGDGTNFPALQFVFTTPTVQTFAPGKAFVIVQNTDDAATIDPAAQFDGPARVGSVQTFVDGLLQYIVHYGSYSGSVYGGGVNSGGNDIVVEFTSVPEPASLSLLAAGAALLRRWPGRNRPVR